MKKRKHLAKGITPLPLRVNFQIMWRWSSYPANVCSQCQAPIKDGALAELYMPLHPPTTYTSEAEAFQAADDACNALADQQEQGIFTLYGTQMYCETCAEKAIVEDIGSVAAQVIADLRQAHLEQFWIATHLKYEPGAYGKYQPFFIHGIQSASLQLIYSRACHSARRGISDEPRFELDHFRVNNHKTRGAKTQYRRGSRHSSYQHTSPGHMPQAQDVTGLAIDDQGRAHLRTDPSPLACEECGRPGPNKQWHLGVNTGVLCVRCLSKWIEEVNESLGARASAPTENYEPQPGDIYLQELRPGQWNLHRYIAGVWEYQTIFTQGDADRFVSLMRLVGETNEQPIGRRRYYRPLQA